MKRILGVLAFAAVFAASSFAFDLGDFPKGTWVDENWDANWVFGVNSLQLVDGKTGDVLYDFKDVDPKINASPTGGLTVTFTCKETHRTYKFTKPVSLDTSIVMDIDRDWTSEHYTVTMPMKK